MGHTIVKTNLLFFAVVCTDDETSERLCHPVFQEWWDQNVVPGLAMKWYTYEYEQKQGELSFTHQGTKRRSSKAAAAFENIGCESRKRLSISHGPKLCAM
jgi:hypothetical protein